MACISKWHCFECRVQSDSLLPKEVIHKEVIHMSFIVINGIFVRAPNVLIDVFPNDPPSLQDIAL